MTPRKPFFFAPLALFVCLAFSSSARAADTDEFEVSVLAGMHVRSDLVSPPGKTSYPISYDEVDAGATGALELAYRHDRPRWSFATGLRVQYESYELNGWFSSDPSQSLAPPPNTYVTSFITSFRDTMIGIGVPLRAQSAHDRDFVFHVVVEPLVVAAQRQLVADYTHVDAGKISVERGVTTRDDHQHIAVYTAAGLGYRAGPGRLVAELGGRFAADVHGPTGYASPAGWSVLVGYRLGVR